MAKKKKNGGLCSVSLSAESVHVWLVSVGRGTGSIKARFENLAKQNEEEDKKRAQEERARRQAKEKQEQEEARRKEVCVRVCVWSNTFVSFLIRLDLEFSIK